MGILEDSHGLSERKRGSSMLDGGIVEAAVLRYLRTVIDGEQRDKDRLLERKMLEATSNF